MFKPKRKMIPFQHGGYRVELVFKYDDILRLDRMVSVRYLRPIDEKPLKKMPSPEELRKVEDKIIPLYMYLLESLSKQQALLIIHENEGITINKLQQKLAIMSYPATIKLVESLKSHDLINITINRGDALKSNHLSINKNFVDITR